MTTKGFLNEINIDHVRLGNDGIGEVVSRELELALMDDKGQRNISDVSFFDARGIVTKPKIILSWGALGQEGIACTFLVEETLKNSVEKGRSSVWFGNLCLYSDQGKRGRQGEDRKGFD